MTLKEFFGYLSTKNLYVLHIVNNYKTSNCIYLFNNITEIPFIIESSVIDTVDIETISNPDFIDMFNNSVYGNHKATLLQYFNKNKLVYITITID